MTRISTVFIFALLTLTGCPDECDSAVAECDSGTDNDGTGGTAGPDDFGTLEVACLVSGVAEDCFVNYHSLIPYGQNGSFNTADKASVSLPVGPYEVTVGDKATDCGGVPCHTSPNGVTRVAPVQTVEVAKNTTSSVEVGLAINVDGRWDCMITWYYYDESVSDFKGAQYAGRPIKYWAQDLWVLNGYRLMNDDDYDFFGLVDADEYIAVRHGDILELVEGEENMSREYILSSRVLPTEIEGSFIFPLQKVVDLACERLASS